VEVQKRGKYWQWRHGSRHKRKSRYGGKFELLPDERKAQYEANKEKRQARAHHGSRSLEHLTERDSLLSVGRIDGTGSKQ
jgi:hypothetical protein